MDHILLIQSSISEHLGCFHCGVIVNNATLNVDIQISVWVLALNSFAYITRSVIDGSYGNPILNFLRGKACAFVTCFFT